MSHLWLEKCKYYPLDTHTFEDVKDADSKPVDCITLQRDDILAIGHDIYDVDVAYKVSLQRNSLLVSWTRKSIHSWSQWIMKESFHPWCCSFVSGENQTGLWYIPTARAILDAGFNWWVAQQYLPTDTNVSSEGTGSQWLSCMQWMMS